MLAAALEEIEQNQAGKRGRGRTRRKRISRLRS
jgi:hypothetical protein